MKQQLPGTVIGVIISALFIVGVTLFPFDFNFQGGFNKILENFNQRSFFLDKIGNIFFFIPWGFSLFSWFQEHKFKLIYALIFVLFLSAGLSTTVEIFQVFLPGRAPSPTDVLMNSLGGLIGFGIGYLFKAKILTFINQILSYSLRLLSLKKIIFIFIGYTVFLFILSISLSQGTKFSNWEPDYPLILGNEFTGDRPWQGEITQVWFTDKVIDPSLISGLLKGDSPEIIGNSLLGYYHFNHQDPYPDLTKNVPPLVWQDKQGQSGKFSSDQWLATKSPATSLNNRLIKTSQFGLGISIFPQNLSQRGPGRIISISIDPRHRNLTLGQDEKDLVLRLRTPVMGENGMSPEFVIQDLLTEIKPYQLILNYDGSTLEIYCNDPENFYRFQFSPEVTLVHFISPFLKEIYLGKTKAFPYQLLSSGILFIPLGILLALLITIIKRKLVFIILFCGVGLLIPTLLLEGGFAVGLEQSIRMENCLLNLSTAVITLLLLKPKIKRLLSPHFHH